MKPRFLLDEHINRAVQRQLRRMDSRIEVIAIGDPDGPPKGISDEDLLKWMEENGYILVTENRSTIPQHLEAHFAAGGHIPGLFWIRPGASLGQVIDELYLIWLCAEAEEFFDRALFIPL